VNENEIGHRIIGAALKVHSALGPGLLESTYEACLAYELANVGLAVQRQVICPVVYEGVVLDAAYRIDMVVGGRVIVELKAVEQLLPVHAAQVLSYLRLIGRGLGYVLNFNVTHMRDGIKRVVNRLREQD
jgi:GxxExxY protein